MFAPPRLLLLVWFFLGSALVAQVEPPKPYGATPTARQLAWHELEFYGFLHFTTNTFTDKEWGYGDESPDIFHPLDFDADQIVRVAAEAGMKALILTCKHHDGFCLWDSKYTEHDVASSPWKNGQGDVVREISEACHRYGLQFGVYLSPWDRNHPEYGRPEYVEYFRNQLKELLTEYGPVFEVWFDGANGGDGYYGGARERRVIDRGSYYGWDQTIALVRALAPMACIFSDAGPDVRWIGNESGLAGDPCWATYTPAPREGESAAAPGTTRYQEGFHGHQDGQYWIPGEVDVSIRPGWFYHQSQNDRVRSSENLVDLWFGSIGHGSSFLLNLPPDRRGQIPDTDVASLQGMRAILDATFDRNLAQDAKVSASQFRGEDDAFHPRQVLDGNRKTYWATADPAGSEESVSAQLTLELPEPRIFNVVDLREYLPLGQRVRRWTLRCEQDGRWKVLAEGQSIGSRRLWRGPYVRAQRIQIEVQAPVAVTLSEVGLYAEPPTVALQAEAEAFLEKTEVLMECAYPGARLRFTLDGSPPTLKSPIYQGPVEVNQSCRVQAVAEVDGVLSPRIESLDLTGYTRDSLLPATHFIRAPDSGLQLSWLQMGMQTLDQLQGKTFEGSKTVQIISIEQAPRAEHVALIYQGWLMVPKDGIYGFRCTSDDGSRLFLDGRLTVDHDGLHGMTKKEGQVGLQAGWHALRVEWFNASGGSGLELHWTGPEFSWQPLNQARFGR
ncbi:MAG: alpha-L-fucosidase [Planctomycetota bacterium]|nr:MAG: alpha-L-fucosidase [Planctomycetota bacterium]